MIGKMECKPAVELLGKVCDEGTFQSRVTADTTDPDGISIPRPYSELLKEVRELTGRPCAVVWGAARIGGMPCIVLVNEFEYMRGSLGAVEAAEICAAMDNAAADHVPFIWLTASGGCRLMEGTPAMLAIPRILAARSRLADAAVPFISVAVGPHLGGDRLITSQADIALAVEKTWLGYVGPRVIQYYDKVILPDGFQTTEWAFANGQLDQVVSFGDLAGTLANLLSVLAPPSPESVEKVAGRIQDRSPSESVEAARLTKPLSSRIYADMCDVRFDLHGDRVAGDDPAVLGGIGRIAGRPVVLTGHNAVANTEDFQTRLTANFEMAHPSGHRKALRLVNLACRLRLPIVTLVDTCGTYPDVEAEAENQPGVLGELTTAMLNAKVPTVGLVLGQAASSGIVPFITVDRLMVADTCYCSILDPDAVSNIIFGTAERADEAARALRVSSTELVEDGVADERVSGMLSGKQLAGWVSSAIDEATKAGVPSQARHRA